MPLATRYLKVTQGNLNNNHLYLTEILDLFPEEVLGGPSIAQAGRQTVRVFWGRGLALTDIDRTKHIFRKRGWVGKFFDAYRVQPGDLVLLEQLGPYEYRIAVADRPTCQRCQAG